MKNYVEFKTIHDIIECQLVTIRHKRRQWDMGPALSEPQRLIKFNTVGIQMDRKSGKSFYTINRLLEDPNAVAFMLRDDDRMFNIRNYELTFGIDLPESVTDRIYTLLQVSCGILDKDKKLIKQSFDTVYIDDADQYLRLLGNLKVYELIASYNPSVEVVLVSNFVPEPVICKVNKWWLNESLG